MPAPWPQAAGALVLWGIRDKLGVSERRACRVLGQHRTTQRHISRRREDEERLVVDNYSRKGLNIL